MAFRPVELRVGTANVRDVNINDELTNCGGWFAHKFMKWMVRARSVTRNPVLFRFELGPMGQQSGLSYFYTAVTLSNCHRT